MRVLVADDDPVTRLAAGGMLRKIGFDTVVVEDGDAALLAMKAPDAPRLAVLDWKMPGKTGLDIVKALRAESPPIPPYLLLVTRLTDKERVIEGLKAGADDYVTKPYVAEEFRLRVSAGARLLGLQEALAGRVKELEDALSRVRKLQGLLVVCSVCKRGRVSHDYWEGLDHYLASHTDVQVSHGFCPECYADRMKELRADKAAGGGAGGG